MSRIQDHDVPFTEALKVWARLGILSFGGPAGQIALMHRLLVDERKWLPEDRFLHALNFCMLLPGPEAMQLATYAGWLLHGWRGGLAAGLLFVLPGALVVLALSAGYAAFGGVPLVEAIFFGVKAAVLAIVIEALLRIAKRALKIPLDWAIAGGAFAAIFFFNLPFPLIVLGAAVIGFLFLAKAQPGDRAATSRPTWPRTAGTIGLWLAVWFAPLIAIAAALGPDHLLAQVALFFSKLAVVTFGGAYAVLAYMTQQAVEAFGWLSTGQMLDGLGLAETTPGPLILVTQFVAFLAGFQADGGGFLLGLLAALVALWSTFAPCFLWIFVGAPYIERLRGAPRLAGALAAITAAVVGVILNLSLWFGLHVVFDKLEDRHFGPLRLLKPDLATIDWTAAALVLLAAVTVFRFRLSILWTLAICALAGVGVKLVLGA